MSAEVKKEIQLEIGHILFIDIVDYSKLLINEQRALLDLLNRLIRGTDQFRNAEAAGRLIKIPTGDGMALVFYNSPETPVECALEISWALKEHPELQLRMGVHSGPVSGVIDVNGHANLAGAGLNVAQRVMDCGDAGHILLSKRVAEDLAEYEHWRPFLHDLGSCEVKHGARVGVVNLHAGEVGNPQLPKKFQVLKKRRARLRWAATTAALLALAAIVAGIVVFSRYRVGLPLAALGKSIAVLPFENLSEEKANAYFADGIQDEVLSTVAKIGDLKVISRTSTAKYKSRPENLRQVGLELGVATVLEGSVQKAGDHVRVIAQLIDATSDNHLWSETYDRELKDIFGVQSEIAQSIATALKAKLSPNETHSLGELPTHNSEAYQAYLKAGYFQREATSRNGDPASLLPQALELYSEAVARDPSFALAWAQMSYTHSWMYWFGIDESPERVRLAEEAAQRAVSVDPQLGETHLALGYVAYWGRRDYAAAMGEFEMARKLLPNNSAVAFAIASVHRRRGEWDAAVAEFKRATSLDPRDASLLSASAYTFGFCRRYAEALDAMERSLAIQPDYWDGLAGSAMLEIAGHGDVVKANALLARLPANVDPQGQIRYGRWKIAMWSRDFSQAVAALQGAPDWIQSNPTHRPVSTAALRGVALEAAGRTEEARQEFERALPLLEEKIGSGAGEPSIYAALGRVYAGIGRADDAVSEGQKAVELLPVSQDAFNGPFYLAQLAEIHARLGHAEEALLIIRQLLETSAGLVVSPALLRLDPAWDTIRKDPGFQKLYQAKQP
jgi:TolB-like protein/class 3 adenylate cyclase/Flp pilus assembly protein TadD